MYFILARENDNAEIQVRFPADPDTLWSEITRLDEYSASSGRVQIVGTGCFVSGLENFIKCADLDSEPDIEKINCLAEQIDSMTTQEQHIFSGALDAERINGLDDVLRVAAGISQYEFIQGVTSDKELGGWVVEKGLAGVDFPQQVRPYLDYAGIGAEYYATHGGTYTPQGYVKRRGPSPAPETKDRHTILLTLSAAWGEYRLHLPTSDEHLDQAKKAFGLDEFAQASISAVQYVPADLGNLIPLDAISVEEANELALWLQQMEQEDGGLMKYRAVLEVEQPDTFSQAVTIAMDIDDYELVPEDMEEYGKQVLRRAGADNEILDTLDGYMNFAQLGQDSLAEDGVRRTEFGLVRRLSAPFPTLDEIGPAMC